MESQRSSDRDEGFDVDESTCPIITETTNLNEPSDSLHKDANTIPNEQQDGVKQESPEGSEDLSEDEPASDDADRSPKRAKSMENDEEDENQPPEKQKQLSSLALQPSKQGNTDVTDSVVNNNGLDNGNKVQAVVTTANAKKSKKKNNNVWVTKSTRKGKKKSKTVNQNTPTEDPVLITPVPRFPDKGDDTPDLKICLSKVYKAEKVELRVRIE